MRMQNPSPVPIDTSSTIWELLEVTTPGAVAFVLGVAMTLLAAVIISMSVIRAAKHPAPTALVLSLSLLTLFAVAGGIATNNDQAWTIAAAGVGALAGSVTSIFREGGYKTDTVEKAVAVVQQLEKQEQRDE
jgi:hypothetical protein